MSVYLEQKGALCDFRTSDPWIILSPIEQSIKRKIEAVGTPLKDWDIQINYGVKTGCNEAFIITTDKREEILANCQTEEERSRTEALIRPILRGRDIKRYGYKWANLWIIATFPSKKYDIEDYPAVKSYLLQEFGIERLEQTGKTHVVNGELIKARKKTNNKWFEVQDSIGYWEDFNKPKIVYSEIVREPQFYLDEKGEFLPEATTFIMTGNRLKYLYHIFHTKAFTYFFKRFYAGGGLGGDGYRYKKAFFELAPIPLFTGTDNQLAIENADENGDIELFFIDMFDFTEEEKKFIQAQE